MMILDELRHLKDLFIKNARHLLHLLSTSAHSARTNITKLLQQYCALLFANAPTKVHQAMVDFNQWLAEVLEDTRSESIEQGLELNEPPRPISVELQAHDRSLGEAFSADNTSTYQLLKSTCECYMTRCESLHQTNADLETQIKSLKEELKEALVHAFEMQPTTEREVCTPQSRRLVMEMQNSDQLLQPRLLNQNTLGFHQQSPDALKMLNVVSTSRQGRESAAAGQATSGRGCGINEVEVKEDGAVIVSESTSSEKVASLEEEGMDVFSYNHRQEASQPFRFRLDSDSSVSEANLTSKCDDVALLASKERSWYHQALRSLNTERKQRLLLRKSKTESAEKPFGNLSPFRAVCMEDPSYEAQEFLQLVSFREPVEDGEDLTWYRRALQHLKNERIHRAGFRDRDSVASTVSIVD